MNIGRQNLKTYSGMFFTCWIMDKKNLGRGETETMQSMGNREGLNECEIASKLAIWEL